MAKIDHSLVKAGDVPTPIDDQDLTTLSKVERIPDLDDLEADTVEAIEAVLEGVSTGEASEYVDLLPSQEQEDILKLAMAQVCCCVQKVKKTFSLLTVSLIA